MKLRAIFFDLDQTLCASEDLFPEGMRRAWKRMRRVRRISWPRFKRLHDEARSRVKKRIAPGPAARSRLLYIKELVETEMGRPVPALTLAMSDAYDAVWSRLDTEEAKRTAKVLGRAYILGVITNQTASWQLKKLARIDPAGRLFKVLVTSEEVGVEKPHPRIFKEALRRAGVRPGEAMMVGDSWETDVLAGRRAGMRAVYLGRRARLPAGVLSIRRLGELPALCESLA